MDEQPSESDQLAPGAPPESSPPGPAAPFARQSNDDVSATASEPETTTASETTTAGPPIDWQTMPSAPTPRRRQFVYVALGVAAFVLVTLGVSIVGGSKSNDPYEAASREFSQKLLSMPEFKAKYGTVTSEDKAYELGQQLAASGLSRLGDADFLRYWQLSNKLLNVADPAPCGRIFRSTVQPAEAKQIARSLDLTTFKELLDVTLLALQADLRDDPPRPPPTSAQVSSAFVKLQGAMGPTIVETSSKLTDPSASDTEVCYAGRAFLAGVLGLGEPDRTVILRYVISP